MPHSTLRRVALAFAAVAAAMAVIRLIIETTANRQMDELEELYPPPGDPGLYDLLPSLQ